VRTPFGVYGLRMDTNRSTAGVVEDLAADPDLTVNALHEAAETYGFDPITVLDQATA
jgi:hypothetical protein